MLFIGALLPGKRTFVKPYALYTAWFSIDIIGSKKGNRTRSYSNGQFAVTLYAFGI